MFLGRPLTLLRFGAPEYELERDHGKVSWRIRDGLLVARAGRGCGFLSLDVRHLGDAPDGRVKVRIEVEVANFYPAIAAGFSTPVYEATQSAIHVLVTHAFLRSLARLDLAPIEGRPLRARPDVRAGAPRSSAPARSGPRAAFGAVLAVPDAGQRPQLRAVMAARTPAGRCPTVTA